MKKKILCGILILLVAGGMTLDYSKTKIDKIDSKAQLHESQNAKEISSQKVDDTKESDASKDTQSEESRFTEEELKIRKESKDKFLSYKQKVDDNGIAIDMRDNPYFTEEMLGYEYPKAQEIEYESGITNTKRHANVILPTDYDENKSYPVLYLLHGLGGSHRTWLNKKADIIIRNLNYFLDVPEMIVVLPNSDVNQQESTENISFKEQVEAYNKTEADLVNYLMPYIEQNFSVKTGPDNTAIAGNSMGGRNTLNVVFKHPELFGYVGAFSSANVLIRPGATRMGGLLENFQMDKNKSKIKDFVIMVGKSDDVCGWVTYELNNKLKENDIPHFFYEVEGGHNTYVWQNAIYNYCQRVFK